MCSFLPVVCEAMVDVDVWGGRDVAIDGMEKRDMATFRETELVLFYGSEI